MSETKGQCRREFESYYADKQVIPSESDWILADAIDRLAADLAEVNPSVRKELDRIAADVAAVKEAVCDGSVAAERDEARANVKKLAAARTGAIYERDVAIRERDEARKERDEARAGADRLRALLDPPPAEAGAGDPHAAWRQAIIDRDLAIKHCFEAIRGRDAAYSERRKAKADAERLRAELAARPAAVGWLTEVERHVLSSMLSERPCDWSLHWADDILPAFRSILDRDFTASTPVVEVPAMHEVREDLPWGRTACEEAQAYRDALDRAGVAWREVPRE